MNHDAQNMMVLLHWEVATCRRLPGEILMPLLLVCMQPSQAPLVLSPVMPAPMQQFVLYLQVEATLAFVVFFVWLFVLAKPQSDRLLSEYSRTFAVLVLGAIGIRMVLICDR